MTQIELIKLQVWYSISDYLFLLLDLTGRYNTSGAGKVHGRRRKGRVHGGRRKRR